MGTITGQQIADRAWIKALDEGVTKRWTAAEALLWLRDAEREVVNRLPKAFTKRSTPVALAGTRQDLVGLNLLDGLTVIDVPRNFNSVGSTPGRAMTKRERTWFDEYRPEWHNDTGTEATHWTQDEQDPKAIYIWPAITGGGRLEVIYSAVPPELASLASAIALDDIYANAIQSLLLSSFFSKDLKSPASMQIAGAYYSLAMNQLGLREKNLFASAVAADDRAKGA